MTNEARIQQIIAEIGYRNRWPATFVQQIIAEVGFQKVMKVFVHQIVVEVGYVPVTNNIYVRGSRYRGDPVVENEAIMVAGNQWVSGAGSGNIHTSGVDYD